MLNREVIKNLDEQDFVTSLIMSDKCCQVLIPYVKLNYFEVDYARVIVSWVIEYYKKFKQAPKDNITSLFRTKCDSLEDEALKELVLNYLQQLSKMEKVNNEDYLLDRSKDFLDYRALTNYTEDLKACLDTKNMDKARKVQTEYKKVNTVELNEASLLSLSDRSIIENALTQEEEILFTLPENLNKVIGNIHRNDFIAILAPPKRGKSFALQYIAVQALKQRLNVVFVSMEMTREEVIQRLWKALWGAESGLIKDGIYEGSQFVEDTSEEGKYRAEPININVKNKVKSVSTLQKRLRTNNNYSGDIKIIAYPRFSASVKQITDRIEEMAEDGFIPDVIIIDYADITTPIGGGSELRNQIDEIWKYLGGFATKMHCCVITASQTNRSGMSSSSVEAESIGENFKKIAHITSMVSLEQTRRMKEEHLMRVRNIAIRNGEVEDACIFPQCLALGQFVFGNPISTRNFIANTGEEDEL